MVTVATGDDPAMSEPSSTPGESSAAYVCVRCTNRFITYSKSPPPCTVCGGSEWQMNGDERRPAGLR
jgi:hypothetical protein